MLKKSFLEALRKICTVRDGDALETLHPGFHEDNLGAGVAAFPESVQQIQAIVGLCASNDVSIVPHGGRTGLAGAGASTPGQLIVDTSRLSDIENVDAVSGTVAAGAGATLQAVQERCAQAGLTPGIDIAARGSATIGGMVSTNAGGMEAFRCGVMRHRVLGLEAVLPDGSLFQDMTRVTKVNEGLDVKHLLIGAEGCLGIVTRAVLKLDALPDATATALAAFATAASAVAAFNRLRARGSLLRAEIMWRSYAETVAQGLGLEDLLAFTDAPILVLFEVSGDDQRGAQEMLETGLMEAIETGEVLDAVFAQSGRQEADMWRVREESWEVEGRYPNSLWYDVSVPLNRLDGYVNGMWRAIEQADTGLIVFVLGHLGDGNLHITIAHPNGVQKWKREADEAVFEGLKQCGGSISAEHGVGLEKMAALEAYGDPGRLAASRMIKQALDPGNLMNPGKILRKQQL